MGELGMEVEEVGQDLAIEVQVQGLGAVLEVDDLEEVEEEQEEAAVEVALEQGEEVLVEISENSQEIVYANQAGTNSH